MYCKNKIERSEKKQIQISHSIGRGGYFFNCLPRSVSLLPLGKSTEHPESKHWLSPTCPRTPGEGHMTGQAGDLHNRGDQPLPDPQSYHFLSCFFLSRATVFTHSPLFSPLILLLPLSSCSTEKMKVISGEPLRFSIPAGLNLSPHPSSPSSPRTQQIIFASELESVDLLTL